MFCYVGLFDVYVYLIVCLLLDILQCLRVCFSFVYAISISGFLTIYTVRVYGMNFVLFCSAKQ